MSFSSLVLLVSIPASFSPHSGNTSPHTAQTKTQIRTHRLLGRVPDGLGSDYVGLAKIALIDTMQRFWEERCIVCLALQEKRGCQRPPAKTCPVFLLVVWPHLCYNDLIKYLCRKEPRHEAFGDQQGSKRAGGHVRKV